MPQKNKEPELELERITLAQSPADCRCWCIKTQNIDSTTLASCAYNILPGHEFQSGLQKSSIQSTRQYWLSKIVLRKSLSLFTDFAHTPEQWVFSELAGGKPVVDNDVARRQGLEFSITHTDGIVFCAITRNKSVGIDVENAEREVPVKILNKNYYSKSELQALHKKNHPSLPIRLWTMKEAYSKAIGMGLSMRFSDAGFDISKDGNVAMTTSPNHQATNSWHFKQYKHQDKYFLSVVVADQVVMQ